MATIMAANNPSANSATKHLRSILGVRHGQKPSSALKLPHTHVTNFCGPWPFPACLLRKAAITRKAWIVRTKCNYQ